MNRSNFYLTIIMLLALGLGICAYEMTHPEPHTCPITYPTRNEMLEHLRDWGYEGDLDNYIGSGANVAWKLEDEYKEFTQYHIENMKQAGEPPE